MKSLKKDIFSDITHGDGMVLDHAVVDFPMMSVCCVVMKKSPLVSFWILVTVVVIGNHMW